MKKKTKIASVIELGNEKHLMLWLETLPNETRTEVMKTLLVGSGAKGYIVWIDMNGSSYFRVFDKK